MVNTYDVGDLVRVTCTYTDADGTAQDPASVYLVYTSPTGTTTTLQYGVDAELVKSATGVYYADINANDDQTWKYRCYSTGTGQAAGEGTFFVSVSKF